MGDPGANAWAPNPDPLTIIGDPSWTDYVVAADVVFSKQQPAASPAASSRRPMAPPQQQRRRTPALERAEQWRRHHPAASGPAAPADPVPSSMMLPCDSTDPAQSFSWGLPAPGYVANTNPTTLSQLCLNVGGCAAWDMMFYECVDDPTQSSCGAPAGQYPNLVWNLSTSPGPLTSAEFGAGWSLTLMPNATLQMLPLGQPGGSPNQTWAYNSTTGALSVPAAGLCLSTTPLHTYAIVCGRITTFDGFTANDAIGGYCLSVSDKGTWELTAGAVTLASGALPPVPPFDPETPHRLALAMAGPVVAAAIDGAELASVVDATFATGNAAVGSGWHTAAFRNFSVAAPITVGLEQ